MSGRPGAVRVRHHADDVKSEAAIKRQRMPSPTCDVVERARKSGVEVDVSEDVSPARSSLPAHNVSPPRAIRMASRSRISARPMPCRRCASSTTIGWSCHTKAVVFGHGADPSENHAVGQPTATRLIFSALIDTTYFFPRFRHGRPHAKGMKTRRAAAPPRRRCEAASVTPRSSIVNCYSGLLAQAPKAPSAAVATAPPLACTRSSVDDPPCESLSGSR